MERYLNRSTDSSDKIENNSFGIETPTGSISSNSKDIKEKVLPGSSQFSLQSFREELDNLTNSIDSRCNLNDLFSEAKKISSASKAATRSSASKLDANSKRKSSSDDNNNIKTPPPIASRRLLPDFPPTRSTGTSSRKQPPPPPSSTTQTSEPPTPVKTPARDTSKLRPDSTPDVFRIHHLNQYSNNNNNDKTDNNFGSTTTRIPNKVFTTATTNDDNNDDNDNDNMKRLVDTMADTIERQEVRIRELEIQNEELRLQLTQKTQLQDRLFVSPSAMNRESTSLLHNNNNSRRELVDDNVDDGYGYLARYSSTASPGTKFVAELSQVLDLPEDHYVPLSQIMDKHFARIADIRRQHGWYKR